MSRQLNDVTVVDWRLALDSLEQRASLHTTHDAVAAVAAAAAVAIAADVPADNQLVALTNACVRAHAHCQRLQLTLSGTRPVDSRLQARRWCRLANDVAVAVRVGGTREFYR